MQVTSGADAIRRIGDLAVSLARRLVARYRRLDVRLRRAVAITGVLAMLGVSAVASSIGTATAEPAVLVGKDVPADQATAIVAAALSCPALTPARLAGQVMAASGFEVNQRSAAGGAGVAALTEATWQRWAPWPQAPRLDAAANILALARHMCDLVGQVRHAGVSGEPWRLALAAYHSGTDAVRAAGGVPTSAEDYVATVAAYAEGYAGRSDLAVTVEPTPPPRPVEAAPTPGTTPRPVPGAYLDLVLAAGKVCATVTPARVAAQLMASSGFNPNLLGPNGGQGIAQFLPAIWARYAAPSASPWDPTVAIPTLGRAMCSLSGELAGLGTDPYPIALAAYQWGTTVVQQAGGVPDAAGLRDFTGMVLAYAEHYARDPRLGAPPAAPTTGPRSGSPSAPPLAEAPPPAPPAPPTPALPTPGRATPARTTPPPATTAPPSYPGRPMIGWEDRCIEVPGARSVDGAQLQMARCVSGNVGQKWSFSKGTMMALGKCMDLAWAGTTDGTAIQLADCNGGWAQQFRLTSAGDIVNPHTDKCVDIRDWGTRLQLWTCSGTANQKWRRG
ncbi:ricin-type beta-trefoil lectin domain protein [Micromonospora sp. NPDC049903]|uniref:ricin-type beta-trefoil lectin domain protein n=1 Tax=Micromonospora sp. NPDC049903 TaxID=3364276 RepID=UPI0037982B3D